MNSIMTREMARLDFIILNIMLDLWAYESLSRNLICEIFRTKKTPLFNYYSKTKGFYFRIIIKQFKVFSHKISHIG